MNRTRTFLVLVATLGLLVLMLVIAGLSAAWNAFMAISPPLKVLVVLAVLAALLLIPFSVKRAYLAWLDVQHAQEALKARQDERRRTNEEHETRLLLLRTRLPANVQGNRDFIYDERTGQVIEVSSGSFIANVPSHYAPRFEYRDTSTRVSEEQSQQRSQPQLGELHIPTFAESLASGEIGPGQRDMLFCYEIVEDEVSGQVSIRPIRGAIGEQHTQLVVAGSQSGKTTYMASNMAQGATLNTVFYIIDPHRNHPEKSISAKMVAFRDWFILPTAMTHTEIAQVLAHAIKVRDARIQGRPTPYDGFHIMFVVDEVPSLMANQRSGDKRIRQLYLDLARFMQSLGIQTAKFGMTGLFASQFATKEALGEIDFRDACMSQLIMRLHPTQAQAMRILGRDAVREIPTFPKGHGFLMLSNATEVLRVASGNVTPQDLAYLASLLPPSPLQEGKASPKPNRNSLEHGLLIPMHGGDGTGSKGDGSRVGNQIDPATQARLGELGISEDYIMRKVDQVTELLGHNKGDIMRAVWFVSPGKGKAYEEAEQEYALVMAIIRYQQAQMRQRRNGEQ